MRLLHYTTAPLTAIRSVAQRQPTGEFDKPAGLWVSAEGPGDWREWCKAEEFGDPDAQRCYEIVLAPEASVLRLSGPNLLRAFSAEYGTVRPHADSGPVLLRDCTAIDWPRVAERYAGILIAPYVWECRLDHRVSWYYGWDCASGCIWDASAVERIVEITPEPDSPDA